MQGKTLRASQVESALKEKARPDKARFYPKFFKAGPGEYAEGDRFLGVVVPDQRKISRQFRDLPLAEIEKLLDHSFHECRLTGLLILVDQFERADTERLRKGIYDFYLDKVDRVNNWDLVDATAHKIVGPYLLKRSRKPLIRLARADHLWKNRIAMISTLHFIKHDEFETTLRLAEILLDHDHDLIHKAVGWMLREVGKRRMGVLSAFLDHHATKMPRTMLRYSIEKMDARNRERYLAR